MKTLNRYENSSNINYLCDVYLLIVRCNSGINKHNNKEGHRVFLEGACVRPITFISFKGTCVYVPLPLSPLRKSFFNKNHKNRALRIIRGSLKEIINNSYEYGTNYTNVFRITCVPINFSKLVWIR